MKVIKRDASLVEFDRQKIYNAIMKAMENGSGIVKPKIAESVAKEIEENPEEVLKSPQTTPIKKVDETLAARHPDLTYKR